MIPELFSTTVRSNALVAKNFSFLPPHGRYMQPDEEYTFAGDLETLFGGLDKRRQRAALVEAVEGGVLQILKTPQPQAKDVVTSVTYAIGVTNGNVVAEAADGNSSLLPPPSLPPVSLPPASVVAYRLDGNFLDSSGNGRTPPTTSANFATGKYGQCLGKGGSFLYSNFTFTPATFTLSVWLKADTADWSDGELDGPDVRLNVSGGSAGVRPDYRLVLSQSPDVNQFDARVVYSEGNGPNSTFGTVTVTGEVWHHLALVRTLARCDLYINGTSVATSATPTSMTDLNLLSVQNGDFQGYIDDLCIIPAALTADQVAAVYASTNPYPV